MFRRAGARTALRSSQTIHSSLAPARTAGRRFISTDPPHVRPRSWKSSALRWGIAVAGIYYYNTSPIFADSPKSNLLNPNVDAMESDTSHSTLDQLTASSRNKAQKDPSALQIAIEGTSEDLAGQEAQKPNANPQTQPPSPDPSRTDIATAGAADLEEEADSEGAFNPVTGEINWDCPCLGGMAYGPCGEEFRSAFSCFVYSNEDPKGMECVDKFQRMQDCFRANPEVYKGELEDDEELDAELAKEKEQLQKEIAERRADVEAKQGSTTSADRGSSEAADAGASSKGSATRTEKTVDKSKKGSSKKSTGGLARSESQPQREAKTTSHTPDEYSSDKEADHGAPSVIQPQRKAPMPRADAGFETDELVTKAEHDASGASGRGSRSRAT